MSYRQDPVEVNLPKEADVYIAKGNLITLMDRKAIRSSTTMLADTLQNLPPLNPHNYYQVREE